VGRISSTGEVKTFTLKTENAGPGAIVSGPDGNLWFVEEFLGQVAKMSTSGEIIKEYVVTNEGSLWGMAAGPDGNLWLTESGVDSILRVTTNGDVAKFSLTPSAIPLFITAGPDGNLWFTENGDNKVGKIDTSGQVTEYTLSPPYKNLGPITTGLDGNLWFIENTPAGAVGKITTHGNVKEYPAPLQNFPEGIIAAGDGALWFPQSYPNSIGRITTSGVFSEVPLTTEQAGGNDLWVGQDGKLWVAEGFAGRMGRLSAIGGKGKKITGTHGQLFKGAVADFEDGTPTASKSDFTANIDWGDGAKSPGTVSGPTGGPFTVSGSHTYNAPGTFKLLVSLTDHVDKSTYLASPGKAKVK
jgi:virginiamycin B lyase